MISSLQDRKTQCEMMQIASGIGLAPQVLYISKDYSFVITEFILSPHPRNQILQIEQNIYNIADSLRKLHHGPKFPREWSVFDYIRRTIPEHISDKQRLLLHDLKQIEQILMKAEFPKQPCHNDIHHRNLFVMDNQTLFIDWEDAGMNDPYWDLARVSAEFALTPEMEDLLLARYFGHVTKLDKSRLFIMKQILFIRSSFRIRIIEEFMAKDRTEDALEILRVNGLAIDDSNKESISWVEYADYLEELALKRRQMPLYKQSLHVIEGGV